MVGQHAFRWAPAHHSIFEISSNRHVIAQLAPWQMHNLKAQRSGPRAIRLDQQRRRAGLVVLPGRRPAAVKLAHRVLSDALGRNAKATAQAPRANGIGDSTQSRQNGVEHSNNFCCFGPRREFRAIPAVRSLGTGVAFCRTP